MPRGVQFTPPPPKAMRAATPADLEAVAKGDSLQLLETWQGSFSGSKLLKAGVQPTHFCAAFVPPHITPSVQCHGVLTWLGACSSSCYVPCTCNRAMCDTGIVCSTM